MVKNFIPSVFSIGPLELYSYGLILGIAGVIIYLISRSALKGELSEWQYLLVAIGAVIGAKALYLAHNITLLRVDPSNFLKITSGGFALYGALIGGILTIFIIRKTFNLSISKVTDSFALGLPLAQAVGRIGNFANNELYGKPTGADWAIFIPEEKRISGYENFETFHPTFAYEGFLDLISFVILIVLFRNKKLPNGVISAVYLLNYGLIRIVLNRFRIDKEYLWGIESSDLLSVIAVGIGIYFLSSLFWKSQKAFSK